MTKTEMLMDRWAGIGRMSNKKTFKPGDKFILELGEERKMFDEFKIAGTDLYVRTDLLEKLTPYKDPEIIHCRDCEHWQSEEYIGNNNVHTLNLASLPCKNWLTAGDWYCGSAKRRKE